MKSEFRHGWDKLSGAYEFNVSTGSVISDIDVHGSRRFTGCTVVQVQQPKGRKPHFAVRDGRGVTVFEIGARQMSAYSALSHLTKDSLESFSWKEERSHANDGTTFLRCRAVVGSSQQAVTGPSIPRIVLDTETTGLHPQYDEILQLAIIDGNGNVLWNRLYKPSFNTSWPDAQRIHHIKPYDVRDKGPIEDDLDAIQDILNRAEQVCAFNAEYDMAFLGEIGLRLDTLKVVDTMREYARKYYEKDFIKLTLAAKECGYNYNAHDALEDCRATLAVQNRVDGRNHSDSRRLQDAVARSRVFNEKHSTNHAAMQEAEPTRPTRRTAKHRQAGKGIPWQAHAILFAFLLLCAIIGLSMVFDQDHSNPLLAEIVTELIFICLTVWEWVNMQKSRKRRIAEKRKQGQGESSAREV